MWDFKLQVGVLLGVKSKTSTLVYSVTFVHAMKAMTENREKKKTLTDTIV